MKSNWRNLEKNTGNLFWGILLLIVSIGLIVIGIVSAADGEAGLLFIIIPLGVFFFIGSIIFLKDAGRSKEIAQEQKQIEDNNYQAVKNIGAMIGTNPTSVEETVDYSEGDYQELEDLNGASFDHNIWLFLGNSGKISRVFSEKCAELEKTIMVSHDIMRMNDEQICMIIAIRLSEMGVSKDDSEKNAQTVLNIYKLSKGGSFDIRSDEGKESLMQCAQTNETFSVDDILIQKIEFGDKEISIPFENLTEFMLFASQHKNNFVVWSKDEQPVLLYKKAYNLYELGLFTGSINVLKSALKLNPIFVSARFELINNYIAIGKLELARMLLLDMQNYIFEEKDCSLFYRRLGFIFAEQNLPELSYSCYRFSQRFEDSPQAKQEIQFLNEHFNFSVNDLDISLILQNNEIPLLKIGDLEQLKKQIGPQD